MGQGRNRDAGEHGGTDGHQLRGHRGRRQQTGPAGASFHDVQGHRSNSRLVKIFFFRNLKFIYLYLSARKNSFKMSVIFLLKKLAVLNLIWFDKNSQV